MQKIFVIILFFGLISCSNSDDRNPVLPNVPVNETVFLNNPSSQNLLAVGGYIEIQGGISGIFVYNFNNTQFFAYDRACPHLPVGDCSAMTITDGISMECECDKSKFALALGGAPQSGTPYAARQYDVVKNGNTLIITNF